MSLLKVATDFAEWFHPQLEKYGLKDIVLYGSVATKGDGKDADIIVFHENDVFTKYQVLQNTPEKGSDIPRLNLLNKLLIEHGYESLEGILKVDSCREALNKGILNVKFVDRRIFSDEARCAEEMKLNVNPNFFQDILSYALVWNHETKKFDIPINKKYSFSK